MQMWVFRITRGKDGGRPQRICPIGVNQIDIENQISSIKPTELKYDGGEVNFVIQELFKYHKLRQGWGIPGLDLSLPDDLWVKNFRIGAWQYWEKYVTCDDAMGRKYILNHMLKMKKGDIIFIPNVSEKTDDSEYFTVATVKTKYSFENRSHMADTWEKDFGHIIGVNNLRTFRFSIKTLLRNYFMAPFLHAVDPIRPHYQSYNSFKTFCSSQYLSL